MAKKPTRLHFTEDELADPRLQKAAEQAEKAADKAEKAVGKLSSQKKTHKLHLETDASFFLSDFARNLFSAAL